MGKMSQEVIVVFVGADKKPNNSITFTYTHCSITISDSSEPKGFLRINALELKARVIGILFEKLIGDFCLLLYIIRQSCEPFAKLFRHSAFHSTTKPPSLVSPAWYCCRASAAIRRNACRIWGLLTMLSHSRSSSSTESAGGTGHVSEVDLPKGKTILA